ncbi:MAG: hypothetical protein GQ553_04355 [Nitrosomonadaceae bacterium]|nr:hypothetical protein [Nitrosomonadaceae bacterium]
MALLAGCNMVSMEEELKNTIAKCEAANIYSTDPRIKRAQIRAQRKAIYSRGMP